ncbi:MULTISPECIES: hypothetical protein [unclassified Streptomyces]|uniref:hypothetical protein n=1 Tax=unclassified Streptomyces TaxID=2593676 RepID=UPI003806A97F|nr:hypothetical protein OG282_31945 [Streptomyces sp. NBC_01014]
MNSERATRLVSALRARGVMAHVAEVGVYQFGVRVVIDWNIEAVWDTDGAAGLDAQVLSDGMLVGFVPHIEGSEDFTEQQLVDAIATTGYSTEGLRPPTDTERRGDAAPSAPAEPPSAPAPAPSSAPRHRKPRKDRWWRS